MPEVSSEIFYENFSISAGDGGVEAEEGDGVGVDGRTTDTIVCITSAASHSLCLAVAYGPN